jgi:hypothetical protein
MMDVPIPATTGTLKAVPVDTMMAVQSNTLMALFSYNDDCTGNYNDGCTGRHTYRFLASLELIKITGKLLN